MKRRTDIEYLAAVFLQLIKRSPANVERAFEIDVDNRAEPVRRQLFGLDEKVSRRPVDNNVDLSKLLDSGPNRLLNRFRSTNIGHNGERLSAVLIDRIRSGLRSEERRVGKECRRRWV